jgi:hypothetical protein
MLRSKEKFKFLCFSARGVIRDSQLSTFDFSFLILSILYTVRFQYAVYNVPLFSFSMSLGQFWFHAFSNQVSAFQFLVGMHISYSIYQAIECSVKMFCMIATM